jgi:hypothetical protein
MHCEHQRLIYKCATCKPESFLKHKTKHRAEKAVPKNHIKSCQLLGCSISYFRQHIESQFHDGMTWDNHGTHWHIEHTTPIKARINGLYPSVAEQLARFHYSNVRPLTIAEHRQKTNDEIRNRITCNTF